MSETQVSGLGTRRFKWSYQTISQKPVDGYIRCIVPGCKRLWHIRGRGSGFIKAGAMQHVAAHWREVHKKENHEGEAFGCQKCGVEV